MKEAKKKAAMYMAACALYMFAADLFQQMDIYLGAVFALVLGMICGVNCFTYGREYERELQKEEDDEQRPL